MENFTSANWHDTRFYHLDPSILVPREVDYLQPGRLDDQGRSKIQMYNFS